MSRILSIVDIKIFIGFTVFNTVFLFVYQSYGIKNYTYLFWNLFLGFLPFALALYLRLKFKKLKSFLLLFLGFVWLLFYPNAPYMITDLIHINQFQSILINSNQKLIDDFDPMVLYEALLFFTFAIESLFMGFYSVKFIYKICIEKLDKFKANIIIFLSLLLASYAIYLGRYLRLNSWEVFTEPLKTLINIWQHLFPISQNHLTYTITFLFTIIQLFLVILIKEFDEEPITGSNHE